MTDDLTPEEREALAGLPRERAPSASLEDRVVAAMREHGHLARPRARVVRITNARVAGLLAACVVLVIGAYSIGLNRGAGRAVLTQVAPATVESIPVPANEKSPTDRQAPPLEFKLNAPQLATPKHSEKDVAKTDELTESMAKSFSERLGRESPASGPAASSPAPIKETTDAVTQSAILVSRSFALPGGTLIVDAPDSVRVVTDASGRILLIHTSEGIIRVRLAD